MSMEYICTRFLGSSISDLPVMECDPGMRGGKLQFKNCIIFVGINVNLRGEHQQPVLFSVELAIHPPRFLASFLEAIYNSLAV